MKKTILIVLAALIGQFAFSQTIKNVIHYAIDENGKVVLSLEGEGYLYKPSQEKAYYLYSTADYITFDINGYEGSNKKVELSNGNSGDFWPMKKEADGALTDCKKASQPFGAINQYNVALFRNSTRSPVLVKDEFLIDGQKVYVWAPERGYVELYVQNTPFKQSGSILAKKGETIRIRGCKRGNRAVLRGIYIDNKEIPTTTSVTGSVESIHPRDVFEKADISIRPLKDTTITKKTKPFDITLVYESLDSRYNLTRGEITVHVDIERSGMPLSLWIPLVSVGGVLLILLIIFWALRAGKKRKSKNSASDGTPVAGILLDYNLKGTKGKAKCEWYPERYFSSGLPLSEARDVDLSKVERVVFILSRSQNTEKAWKNNEDESLRIIEVVSREELLELLNKIDRKRNNGIIVRIVGQYNPERNVFDAWIAAQQTRQELYHTRVNLISNNSSTDNAGNKPIADTTAEKSVTGPSQDTQPSQPAEQVEQQGENKDDKGVETTVTTQDQGKETQTDTAAAARIEELSEKLRQQEEQLASLNSTLGSYKTRLEEQDEALKQRDRDMLSKQNELDIANLKIDSYKRGKEEAEKRAGELADSLSKERQDLAEEKKKHDKTKELLAAAAAEASAQIEVIQKKCTEEIEATKKDCTEQIEATRKDCTNQIEAEKERCTTEIKQMKESCDSRLVNWQADKNTFLDGICKPIERLYSISDDIYSDLDETNRSFSQYMEYIVNNLKEFSDKVQKNSGEEGIWRNGTNAEAEKSIRTELTDLIDNNSSWVNAIARLYCYSRVPEIGDSFESTGIHVADIDSAYRDMVALLGRFGITVIIPRILVDYYDDMSKKYFAFNNEDNAISKFVDRDVLIKNQDTLKIYDMGRIAYYLDGKINKGEIVYF